MPPSAPLHRRAGPVIAAAAACAAVTLVSALPRPPWLASAAPAALLGLAAGVRGLSLAREAGDRRLAAAAAGLVGFLGIAALLVGGLLVLWVLAQLR